MAKIVFLTKAEKSKINWGSDSNEIRLAMWLQDREGKPLRITIEEQTKKRSDYQNAYYWGCVLPAVMETYNKAVPEKDRLDIEDTHELCKREFNFRYIETKSGQSKLGRSTASLSTIQFGEYLDRIKHWGDENGVYIPDPDPELSHNNAIINQE
jgi:hypothetical protein